MLGPGAQRLRVGAERRPAGEVGRVKRSLPAPAAACLAALAHLLLCALATFWSAPAQARWSRVAAANVQESWELIRQAAWAAGIEDQAPLLAALLAHETHLQPLRGRYHADIWGPGQVSWGTWGPLLKKKGVAQQPEDLLLDPYSGILAAAVVLAELRATYPERSLDLALCLYGVGPLALRYGRDCPYSRNVLANLPRVLRVVWARGEGGRGAVAVAWAAGEGR